MRGLLNNEEATRVYNTIKDLINNPIHQIYNLGYKQGYKDAVEETTIRMSEYVSTILEKKG